MNEQLEMFVKCDECGKVHAKWGNVRKEIQIGREHKVLNFCDESCSLDYYIKKIRSAGL